LAIAQASRDRPETRDIVDQLAGGKRQMSQFFEELKRRSVFRVGAAYLAVA